MTDIRLSDAFTLAANRPLFVTGTDTEVGKTYVAVQLIHALRNLGIKVGAYKPVASGCETGVDGSLTNTDAVALWNAIDRPEPMDAVCPQLFAAPVAPPSAAKLEGKLVDVNLMVEGAKSWMQKVDFLVIEGAGGLLSPLADGVSNADLAVQLGADIVIVASDHLGVINHTRMTEHVANSLGLRVAGIILNRCTDQTDISVDSNAEAIRKYCRAPLVGFVEYRGGLVYSNPSESTWIKGF